jgi:hypothetical protein
MCFIDRGQRALRFIDRSTSKGGLTPGKPVSGNPGLLGGKAMVDFTTFPQ